MQTTSVETHRVSYIDLGAGIMILWMIVYHAWGLSGTNPCYQFPYLSFFMPWFFYKSGLFFCRRPIRQLFWKDANKLLVTYFIWTIIGVGADLVYLMLDGSLSWWSFQWFNWLKKGVLPLNSPLWFLIGLFFVRMIFNAFSRKLHPLLICLLGALVAITCRLLDYRWFPLWIAYSGSGLCFFSLGYWLKSYEQKWWLFLPTLMIYVFLLLGFVTPYPMVDMFGNHELQGLYLLWFPCSIAGIVVFNTLCKYIDLLCQKYSVSVIFRTTIYNIFRCI